ncbi:MAG: hypothetical protein FJY67_06615 [Calditrichaeota bacterium]|nr:hypothetical protein [Calditrichota bacterium]
MPPSSLTRAIDDSAWDRKEFDWTGKTFYFTTYLNLLGLPIGLPGKLEQLNRDVRTAGHKIKNPMVFIQVGKVKARAMVEIEKPEALDSQVFTYDIPTNVDSIVHYGGPSTLARGVERLKERVYSRRTMEPREIYYLYQDNPAENKMLLVGLT